MDDDEMKNNLNPNDERNNNNNNNENNIENKNQILNGRNDKNNDNNNGIENDNLNIESNSNTINSTEQVKPKKIKKKKKHRFLKFLLIVFLIIVGIKVFHIVKDAYNKKKFDEFVANNILVLPSEEIKLTSEELKQDTNSDGISNEDKIKLGLDILSDDTDGDGLTDYDEINVYHSDPKKYSTSGDILSDGYKIQKGYDINKYYGNSATITTENKNITLTVDNAEDIEAYYKEYNGTVPSEYTLAMKPFRIYSYTGQAEVKIENPNYYEVISYDNINKKATDIEFQVKDNSIIFNITNDNPILIVFKNNLLDKLGSTINSRININNNVDSEYIVIAMPIFNVFFDVPIYIFQVNNFQYKNSNNTVLENKLNSKNDNIFKVVVSYINSFGAKVLDFFFGRIENQLASYTADSEEASFIHWFLIYKHVNSSTDLENYLFGETEDNNENTNKEKEEEIKYDFENKYDNAKGSYYADSGFSVTKNAFNFSNLSTAVSEGGVCMGFAHVTSNMYNGGNLAKSIKSKYDLSNNAYNTIWNKQLYSYKATSDLATYADEISGNEPKLDSSNMEQPDAEVVKTIEYYFETINSKVRMKKFSWAWNSAGGKQTYISSDTINNLVSKFKSGKIVSVLLLADGQHAINAYKIVEDQDDEDILYLKAYDNNFPADMWWNEARNGKQKYDVTITLKRCYKNTIFGGTKTYYLYDYNPLNNDNYHYGNISGGTDFIVFIDENGNTV